MNTSRHHLQRGGCSPSTTPLLSIAFICLVYLTWADAWIAGYNGRHVHNHLELSSIRRWHKFSALRLSTTSTSDEETTDSELKPSFYQTQDLTRRGRPIWKERKQLSELKTGDVLHGFVVQEYLDGETGPKVFLECGIGCYNERKKTWKLANAMLRLGGRGSKLSVAKKRVARLRKQTSIECYVSRIRPENGHLEVVLHPDSIPEASTMVSVSSLKPGQQVVGTVQKLLPYGAFVDVGANRVGLLHIQKVADLYGNYIDKEKGLIEAGLDVGTKIKVQVESNEKKRLFLDFTPDVKEEAEKDRLEHQKRREEKDTTREKEAAETNAIETTAATAAGAVAVASASLSVVSSVSADDDDVSQHEAHAWAAYAEYANDDNSNEQEDDPYAEYADDYKAHDDYDEDRDIEDALGLGSY